MVSGRAADREDPKKSRRSAARSLDRDPISEFHQGQRSHAPHQRAGHMTAPDHFAKAELKILRRRGPSTYVENRRCDAGKLVGQRDRQHIWCIICETGDRENIEIKIADRIHGVR